VHSRLLRGEIITSDIIDKLNYPAEVFYRRLLSVVEDFGRFDGRESVIKAKCYPLRLNRVRESDITRWMAECHEAGAIVLYTDNGKPYLVVPKVQAPRALGSKLPEPPAAIDCWRPRVKMVGGEKPRPVADHYHGCLHTDANGCAQLNASDNNGMQMRPYSYPYSDSNSDSLTAASGGSKGGKKLGRREKVLSEAGVIQ
jgi:hypothetical protein